jgi:hypothetical protein
MRLIDLYNEEERGRRGFSKKSRPFEKKIQSRRLLFLRTSSNPAAD